MTQFTTLKEYDNAVRASQRKLKALNERLEANPLDGAAQQERTLAQAAHKFLLACRAKFKETGVAPSADVLKAGGVLKAPDLSQAPKLRPEQEQALREGFERGPDPVPVMGIDPGAGETTGRVIQGGGKPDLVIIDDPISPARTPYDKLKDWAHGVLAGRKPTAAEPQAPTPIDRAREFVPQARIIRERSHAGAMREPKYAADDCRSAGLGYKRVHRKGEAWRRTVALAVVPKFPSERYFTQRAMPNHSKRRITVNGQAWA